jgi:hypothetical protein
MDVPLTEYRYRAHCSDSGYRRATMERGRRRKQHDTAPRPLALPRVTSVQQPLPSSNPFIQQPSGTQPVEVLMSDPTTDRQRSAESGGAGSAKYGAGRRLRPAPLLFEPPAADAEAEHFFDLESIDDPQELLRRSTELALAFRAAAERATDYQAVAAAQLADPCRFDSLTATEIADRADWTPDYAAKMVEYGRGLEQQRASD